MVRNVALSEAKDRLSEFVAAAEDGDEIVITRHGKAVAKLVAIADRESRAALAKAAWDTLRRQRDAMRAAGQTATMKEMVEWINEGRL